MKLSFLKMNGAGNDFVVIDNRDLQHHLSQTQIEDLCDRHRGIGADGLLAVEPAENGADYKFRYYNADGGEAEMCGNGARCFGAYTMKLADKKEVQFETIAGTLGALAMGSDVQIAMSTPFDLHRDTGIKIDGLSSSVSSINTGVPHTVAFTESLSSLDVKALGAVIRYHDFFSPAGTNANFAQVLSSQHLAIRTYERGVEGETLACGTGMVACALLHHLNTGAPSPIKIDVAGGDTLEIGFTPLADDQFTDVTLTGPADFVFEGTIQI